MKFCEVIAIVIIILFICIDNLWSAKIAVDVLHTCIGSVKYESCKDAVKPWFIVRHEIGEFLLSSKKTYNK